MTGGAERAESRASGASGAAARTPGTAPALCVFCASGPVAEPHVALAAEVGAEIARRGWTLVSGGGRVSMMGAVARGAREGGARTVGVIPDALVMHEVADDDADELVVVTDMRARKGEMDARSDAVLALPGGLGTLEELFEAWTSHALSMHDKPVVVLDPDGHYDGLFGWLDGLRGTGFVSDRGMDALVRARDVASAFAALEARLVRG